MSASTSSSRVVSSASFAFVVARGPRGRSRTPLPRSSRATRVASGRAPSRCSSACACAAPPRCRPVRARAPPRTGSSVASTPLLPPSSGRQRKPVRPRIVSRPSSSRPASRRQKRSRWRSLLVALLDRHGRASRRCGVNVSRPALEPRDLRAGRREVHMGERSSVGTPTAVASTSASRRQDRRGGRERERARRAPRGASTATRAGRR